MTNQTVVLTQHNASVDLLATADLYFETLNEDSYKTSVDELVSIGASLDLDTGFWTFKDCN